MLLNSREQAIAVWGLIFLIWILAKSDIRIAFWQHIKSFVSPKIVFPLLIMFTYITVEVWLLAKINLWDLGNLKDTFIWTLVAVFTLFFQSNEVIVEHGFFRTKIIENLKLAAIVQFVVNLYTFPFLVEFILIPFLIIIMMSIEFIKEKEEFRNVRKLLEWILTIIGFGILSITIRYLWLEWQNVVTIQTIFNFLLPFILTVMIIPFIYCLALLIEYETIFTRIDIFTSNKSVSRYAKREIIRAYNIHLYRLHHFSKSIGVPRFRNYNDVKSQIH